ncbi:GNAT family N-acetyltransferase [Streptomyces sp. NPDC012751]|uniref:GNAT family N-acetyltransferase n=1 Tax=Streptomyces sp. NPDC012751 TaxID=3364846 RepID=UPI0036D07187
MERTARETTAADGPRTIVLRPARPGDAEAIAALDGSFTTDTVFEVTATDRGFGLREVPVRPPLRKVFPDEDAGPGTDAGDPDRRTVVALDGDELCGFAAASFAPWNERVTVHDIEVAPARRGRGVGRALMGHVVAFARERGAAHVWLEVSNVNAPAIHAYRRMGFAFCGLDTSLYAATGSAGEQALFMARPVR